MNQTFYGVTEFLAAVGLSFRNWKTVVAGAICSTIIMGRGGQRWKSRGLSFVLTNYTIYYFLKASLALHCCRVAFALPSQWMRLARWSSSQSSVTTGHTITCPSVSAPPLPPSSAPDTTPFC